MSKQLFNYQKVNIINKSRIRETPTLSTDADSRTDTNLKRLRDLSNGAELVKIGKIASPIVRWSLC